MDQNNWKIIKIIDNYQVVVNAGHNDVAKGDILEVYVEGSPVLDPDTNEELGTLDYIKALLEVDVVYPKMCLCKNSEIERIPAFNFAALETIQKLQTKEKPKPLPIDASEISGGFNESDRKIRTGDKVRRSLNHHNNASPTLI